MFSIMLAFSRHQVYNLFLQCLYTASQSFHPWKVVTLMLWHLVLKNIHVFFSTKCHKYTKIYIKPHTMRLSSHQKILQQPQHICQASYVLGFRVVFNFLFVPPCGKNKYAGPKI